MTANLMNCHVKRGHEIKVDDLVGLPRYSKPAGRRLSEMTPGEREKWREDRKAARATKS